MTDFALIVDADRKGNNMADKDKRANYPTSVRLDEEYLAIVEEIIAMYSPPGVKLSVNDAIKVALSEWKKQHDKAQRSGDA